jgi:lipid A 3-O-deacylase
LVINEVASSPIDGLRHRMLLTCRSPAWFRPAALLALCGCLRSLAAADSVEIPVSSLEVLRYEWEVSSGVLWSVGGGATPLDYVLTPVIVSLRIPPVFERPLGGGILVHRARFSLLMEPIVTGPEHYYFGAAAAGELEWRQRVGRWSALFAAGGGFGVMDSKGYEVAGGQGQDFNLNWLINLSAKYRARSGWQASAGLYFQHISNRGMDKVNPGLNALGPTFGISRRF